MTVDDMVEAYVHAARSAVTKSRSEHPEDVAYAMVNAIEDSYGAVWYLWNKEKTGDGTVQGELF